LAAIICGSITAESAEKWSCEMEMSGKLYKQEWIVSDDKMFAPKGKGYFRVVLNNSDTLFAFVRLWPNPKDRTPKNMYVVIAKSTGVVTEFDDFLADYNFGPNPDQWGPPVVTVGHCSLEQP
jgi:hypothetical protein